MVGRGELATHQQCVFAPGDVVGGAARIGPGKAPLAKDGGDVRFAETFAQDRPPDIARAGAARLVRQTLAVTHQPVQAAARHDLPTTYVVCAQDRGTPAAAQREFARRADTVIEVNAGHHPFLSKPQTVAGIIAGLS